MITVTFIIIKTTKSNQIIHHQWWFTIVTNRYLACQTYHWYWSFYNLSLLVVTFIKIKTIDILPVKHIIGIGPVQLAATCQALIQLDERCWSGAKQGFLSWSGIRLLTLTSSIIMIHDPHDNYNDKCDYDFKCDAVIFTRLRHRHKSEFPSRPLSCNWADGRLPLGSWSSSSSLMVTPELENVTDMTDISV